MAPAGIKKPWVDGPHALIETPSHRSGLTKPNPKCFTADQMSQAHNAFIRGLNAVTLQARGVHTPADISDFCRYSTFLLTTMHLHHHTEEEFFFPRMEKALNRPGSMTVNVEQHEAFEKPMHDFEHFCEMKIAKPSDFDVEEYLVLLNKMAEPLVKHLHEEIDSLVALEKNGDPDGSIGKEIWDDLEKRILKVATKDVEYPYAIGAIDKTYENGMWSNWPPVPFFVPWLVNYWYARKWSGAWRFSPCYNFQPRDLQFLPTEA